MTFRPLTELLRELASRPRPNDDIVNVYIVVDDPKADEPLTKEVALTESRLAREESNSIAQMVLEHHLVDAFRTWRNQR